MAQLTPNDQKDIPFVAMLSNKNRGSGWSGKVAIAQRLVGHQSACRRWSLGAFVSLWFFFSLSFIY